MIRVLAWPAFAHRETNPYTALLYEAIAAQGVEVDEFTSRRALRGGYDIFHIHWPDYQVSPPGSAEAFVRVARFLGLVSVVKAGGAKIVWTAHNTASHERHHPAIERLLWRGFDRLTDGVIGLSETALELVRARHPRLHGRPSVVVPHGHYRASYPPPVDRSEARRLLGLPEHGRVIAFLGTLRPYKRVPDLVRAFIDLHCESARLLIAGHRDASVGRAELEGPGVVLRDEFVPESEVPVYLGACDLVVLPYAEILNSGAALLALSFNRPVLLPARGAMLDLQKRVGKSWVRVFDGDLSSHSLRDALEWASRRERPLQADLDSLEWPGIASDTIAFYKNVLAGGRSK